tara:strand:+ start:235 stop:474 length:240 start_codon:yes stop_codon:yes gene_type:complete
MKLKYNTLAVCVQNIQLVTELIPSGAQFWLVDVYKQKSYVVVGIRTDKGIQEALFKIPKSLKIKNKKQLKHYIESYIRV